MEHEKSMRGGEASFALMRISLSCIWLNFLALNGIRSEKRQARKKTKSLIFLLTHDWDGNLILLRDN